MSGLKFTADAGLLMMMAINLVLAIVVRPLLDRLIKSTFVKRKDLIVGEGVDLSLFTTLTIGCRPSKLLPDRIRPSCGGGRNQPMLRRLFVKRNPALAALVGIAVTCGAPVFAAETPVEVLVAGSAHQALFAMDFDGDRGVAVGAAGEVQLSADGGRTWTRGKAPTDLALLGVNSNSARTIAVGQGGTILIEPSGGTWEKIESGTTRRLFGISSTTGELAVAVGEFGTLLLSQDAGKSWEAETIDWAKMGIEGGAEPHLYGVTIAQDGVISVVGEFGLVIRSADAGRSWQRRNFSTASLLAIEIRDNGVGFAVGQDGYALRTTDGGLTWTPINVGSKAILNGVSSTADGKVAISAMRAMFASSDDGLTWQPVQNAEIGTIWFVGVAMRDLGVLVAGQAGRIVRVGS